MARRGVRGVRRHALHHLRHVVGLVGREQRALQRVALAAADQRTLLLLGARHRHQPFGVRQLRVQPFRLHQREIDLRRRRRRDIDLRGGLEIVANGADRHRVGAGIEPAGGEMELALRVRDDRHGDRRARALGADDNAFHRAFLRRGRLARERLREGRRRAQGGGGDAEHQRGPDCWNFPGHGFPPRLERRVVSAGFIHPAARRRKPRARPVSSGRPRRRVGGYGLKPTTSGAGPDCATGSPLLLTVTRYMPGAAITSPGSVASSSVRLTNFVSSSLPFTST